MSEEMQYTINAGQAISELKRLTQENASLQQAALAAGKAGAAGAKEAKLSQDQYFQSLAQNHIRMRQLKDQIVDFEKSQKKLSGSFVDTRMAAQQLTYGINDAAVSFGTGGYSGAIRGAANNLDMLATSIHPIAGLVVGVGMAIASGVVKSFEDASKAAKELEEDVSETTETLKKFDKAGKEVTKRLGEQKVAVEALRDAYRDLNARTTEATSEGEEKDQRKAAQADQKALQPFVNRMLETNREKNVAGKAFLDAEKKLFAARKQVVDPNRVRPLHILEKEEADAEKEFKVAEKRFRVAENVAGEARGQFLDVRQKQEDVRGLEAQGRGEKRVDNFAKDVRKKFRDFQEDFGKAAAKKFDPLQMKIEAQEDVVKLARIKHAEEKVAAEGPARGPGDREGVATKSEKKVLDLLERTVNQNQIILDKLLLEKEQKKNLPALHRNAQL